MGRVAVTPPVGTISTPRLNTSISAVTPSNTQKRVNVPPPALRKPGPTTPATSTLMAGSGITTPNQKGRR